MFYWLMKNLIAGPLLRGVFRPWVVGLDNVPANGAVILASNHLSFIDSIFLPIVVDRHVSFLAKSDYFTRRGLKGWATRAFMNGTGQLPIDRSGGKASEASLNTGLAVLARGEILGIYPEGTRSPDGKLYRGRTGVARMILEAGVPVVPVAMIDTAEIMPIGKRLPRIGRIGSIIVGSRSTSPGSTGWRATASSCAPSPTRSCTSCSASGTRNTSMCTPARSRRSGRRCHSRTAASAFAIGSDIPSNPE